MNVEKIMNILSIVSRSLRVVKNIIDKIRGKKKPTPTKPENPPEGEE